MKPGLSAAFLTAMTLLMACTPVTSDSSLKAISPSPVKIQETEAVPTFFNCPVTIPNSQTPPLEKSDITHHGNGSIWTVLPKDGILLVPPSLVNPDGSLEWKAPWWRSPRGAPLTLSGLRQDADAPPFTATLPPDYMDYVQSVGWHFPTEGCWEITGKTDAAVLTFTLLVLESSATP